ncbi:MAG: serine/threonine-protein kinase [Crocosphaera sp.]|nr:serine/threonine-protein kinase [Crocosphaera sp.]
MLPILLKSGDKIVSCDNESYTIKKPLGYGGYGIVYRAIDDHQKKIVAIKTLKFESENQDITETTKKCEELKKEAKILKSSNHHHIVKFDKVIYSPDRPGIPFLIMEYVDGLTMREYLKNQRNKKLSIQELFIYIQQICDALAVVHARGILHRDVNPNNIIIRSGKLEAVLIDFGIAEYYVPGEEQNFAKNIGHSGYAPPESFFDPRYSKRHNPNKKEGKYSDVYSVAGLMYYLIVGEDPLTFFHNKEFEKTMLTQLKENNVPENVIDIIKKAMSLNSQERYQSVKELSNDLKKYKNHDFSDKFTLLKIDIEKKINYLFNENLDIANYIIRYIFNFSSQVSKNLYFHLKKIPKIVLGILVCSIIVGVHVWVVAFVASVFFPPPKKSEDTNLQKNNQTRIRELPKKVIRETKNTQQNEKKKIIIDRNDFVNDIDSFGREKTVVELFQEHKQDTTRAFGVIISRNKNEYIVLTTMYNILGGNTNNLRVKTFDDQIHKIEKVEKQLNSQSIDVALIYFKRHFTNYPFAQTNASLDFSALKEKYQEEFFINDFDLRKNHSLKLVNIQQKPDLDRQICAGYQYTFEVDIPPSININGSPIFNSRKEIIGVYCGEDNNSLQDKTTKNKSSRKIRVIPIDLIKSSIFGNND